MRFSSFITIFGVMPVVFLAWSPSAQGVLVHQWTFDEGSGTTAADSIGGADATLFDDETATDTLWGVGEGARASFLQLDGDDDYADPALIQPQWLETNAESWTAWLRQPVGDNDDRAIVLGNRMDNNTPAGGRLFVKFGLRLGGRLQFNDGGGINLDFPSATPGYTDNFPGDTWIHVAGVRDGGDWTWYVDGDLVNETPLNIPTNRLPTVGLPFFIGGEGGLGASEHFLGGIDDVRIYDHALTPAEVILSMSPIDLGLPGDADGNGTVGLEDLAIVRGNYFNSVTGAPGELFEQGDMNIDGIVDFLDYRIWKDNYTGQANVTLFGLVPEPAGVALGLLGGIVLGGVRRRI